MSAEPKRRWRDYRTAADRRPVKEFIDGLSDVDAAAVVAAMKDVRETGLAAARQDVPPPLRAGRPRRSRVLRALEGFSKKTQRTPPAKIELAERRLADWQRRGRAPYQR